MGIIRTIMGFLGLGPQQRIAPARSSMDYGASALSEDLRQEYRFEMATRIQECRPVCSFAEWQERRDNGSPMTVIFPVEHAAMKRRGTEITLVNPALNDAVTLKPVAAKTGEHADDGRELSGLLSFELPTLPR